MPRTKKKIDRGDAVPTIIHVSKSKKPILKKIAKEKGYRSTKHLAESLIDKTFDEYKDTIK